MKQTIKITASWFLVVLMLFCVASCAERVDATGLWESATYLSDTTLGRGENTVKVEIVAGEQSITLTVKTDKETLGEALYEQGLVNDPSFFDTCNGMTADWERDQAYWAFYVGDEPASYGIGDAQAVATEDVSYRIVYTE